MADDPTVGEIARNQQALSLQLQLLSQSKVDKQVHDLQIRELERDRDDQDRRIDTLERRRTEESNRRWVTLWAPTITGVLVGIAILAATLLVPHIFR